MLARHCTYCHSFLILYQYAIPQATPADEDTKHNTVSDHMKKYHNSDKQKRQPGKFIKIGKISSLSKIYEESSGQHFR